MKTVVNTLTETVLPTLNLPISVVVVAAAVAVVVEVTMMRMAKTDENDYYIVGVDVTTMMKTHHHRFVAPCPVCSTNFADTL
jgi:hypothetical protein